MELDINFEAVEKKIIGLVNMKKDQGRKDPLEADATELREEIYLEPKTDFAKENKNKTTVKMMPATKIKENTAGNKEPALGTTTSEVADLRKAINAVKPKVQTARIDKPVIPKRPLNPKVANK